MRYLFLLIISIFTSLQSSYAQSQLLENVKRNPEEANILCDKFKDFNSNGISSYSSESIEEISRQKKLNLIDAEILSVYVIGMNCPNVF